MKKWFLFALFAGLLMSGCQKSQDITPVSAADAAAQTAAAPDQAKEHNAPNRPSSVIDLKDMGFEDAQLVPQFPTTRATKGGVFKLDPPGNLRYFAVSEEDNTITDDQFSAYCSGIYEHVKSIADDGDVRDLDVDNMKALDTATVPDPSLANPMALSYKYQGVTYGLFVRYKKYQPGTFLDISTEMNAVYVGFYKLD